jgi:hypothetical protein
MSENSCHFRQSENTFHAKHRSAFVMIEYSKRSNENDDSTGRRDTPGIRSSALSLNYEFVWFALVFPGGLPSNAELHFACIDRFTSQRNT